MRRAWTLASPLCCLVASVLASCAGSGDSMPSGSSGAVGASGVGSTSTATSTSNGAGGASGATTGPGGNGAGPVGFGGGGGQWNPMDTHVDGGTECAPEGGVFDKVACCDGVSCHGWCYETGDGGLTCSCGEPSNFGIPGGCPDGTTCCEYQCKAPGHCGDP